MDTQFIIDEVNARGMQTGDRTRIGHCPHCTQGSSSVACEITQEPGYIRWWCYRCQTGGKIGATGLSLEDQKQRFYSVLNKNKFHKVKAVKPDLPSDCIKHVPNKFRVWLWGYDLGVNKLIKEYDVRYSESYDRLIFPVYDTKLINPSSSGQLLGWAGRSETKPYDKRRNPKWRTRQASHVEFLLWTATADSNITVITEDIVSAIKVHKAGYNSVALIKSFVPPSLILKLTNYKTVLWLDYDMINKIHRQLGRFRSYGCTVRSIQKPGDPKDFSLDEIGEIITDGCA